METKNELNAIVNCNEARKVELSNSKNISKLYQDARTAGVNEMIRLSLEILKKKPEYESCVIAMGIIMFTHKEDNNSTELTYQFFDGQTYKTRLSDPSFGALNSLINEWDELLTLTVEGIQIKADGEIFNI